MYSFRSIIFVFLVCSTLQQLVNARRRRNFHVSEAFSYNENVQLYGSTLTANIDVKHITEPENILEVEVARGRSYEGISLINFNNGVIVIKTKSGSCAIRYNQATNVENKQKAVIKMLKDAKDKENGEVLTSFICKTHGNIRLLSPYGERIGNLCHSLDDSNVLVNYCRYATEEENEAYSGKCDVGFVYIDDKIELGCVRAWI